LWGFQKKYFKAVFFYQDKTSNFKKLKKICINNEEKIVFCS